MSYEFGSVGLFVRPSARNARSQNWLLSFFLIFCMNFNPLMHMSQNGQTHFKKSCSKCCKIFKVCLTILGRYWDLWPFWDEKWQNPIFEKKVPTGQEDPKRSQKWSKHEVSGFFKIIQSIHLYFCPLIWKCQWSSNFLQNLYLLEKSGSWVMV